MTAAARVVGLEEATGQYEREALIEEIGAAALRRIYADMLRTRTFDDNLEELIRVHGFSFAQHATTGQEASQVAACAVLSHKDYVTPYHRGWGWAIGKGMEPAKMLAEFLGRSTGYNRGHGGVQLAN